MVLIKHQMEENYFFMVIIIQRNQNFIVKVNQVIARIIYQNYTLIDKVYYNFKNHQLFINLKIFNQLQRFFIIKNLTYFIFMHFQTFHF